MKELVISSFMQLGFVLLLSSFFYGIYFLTRRKKTKESFNSYLGLNFSKKQFDSTYWVILTIGMLFGAASTWVLFEFSDALRKIILNDSSPYYKILKNNIGFKAILMGASYSFIQSGASEELLFRGLIGKRFFNKFSLFTGNIGQALIFWLMHLLMFRAITGSWVSLIQLYAFVTSFGAGLLCGYVNYRRGSYGIAPSWLFHSFLNFAAFLTLFFLI